MLQLPLVIKTPHALPMYREDQGKGRKRPHEREADEAVRTRRPDPGGGIAGLGLGKGGKLGATGGTLLTQYILQNQVGRCTPGDWHVSVWRVASDRTRAFVKSRDYLTSQQRRTSVPKSSVMKVIALHAMSLVTPLTCQPPSHIDLHIEVTCGGVLTLRFCKPALSVTSLPDIVAGKTDNFSKFTAAYQETQPKPLYAEEDDAEEER